MIEAFKVKCDNLITLLPTNLYLNVMGRDESLNYAKVDIPAFLKNYVDHNIEKLSTKYLEKEDLSDHKQQVHLYIDPFRLCYLTWLVEGVNHHHLAVTMGPFLSEQITRDEARYIGFKMKLGSENCFILESFYSQVPYYDQLNIIRVASLVIDYLNIETHLPRIIREDQHFDTPDTANIIAEHFPDFDFVENNFKQENQLLHAIETGDIRFLENMKTSTNMDARISVPSRFPNDPLREMKNLAITLNSIAMRAALKGGLNISMAHSISHNFAIQIEQMVRTEAILKLDQEIMETYTRSVRKYAMKGHSDMVISAVNYIRTHLVQNIQLSHIANELHVSKEHLSRKFKLEMGITITTFIHKAKIEESLPLLESGQYTISSIAYTFGYSSPAHYSKAFKQIMDVPPKAYMTKKRGLQA